MNDMSNTELVTIPTADALAVFTTPNAIDPILQRVRTEIDAFEADISTATGRKAVASMAHKVAKAKARIEEAGKALADQQKEIPKKIDATRKKVRETLEAWQAEVRKPLTDWEDAEEARVNGHKAILQRIEACGNGLINGEPKPFGLLFFELDEVLKVGPSLEEFETEAHRLKDAALSKLKAAQAEHQKREAEQQELERLRAEAIAREQKDREQRIASEATERAKRELEAIAAAAIKAAEDAAQKERQDSERRELELKLKAEQAERRAAEAEATAKREAQIKLAAEQADQARREADKQHRATINKAALDALIAGGIDAGIGKAVITLIASKAIPNISIHY